jgi:hypothetical protein
MEMRNAGSRTSGGGGRSRRIAAMTWTATGLEMRSKSDAILSRLTRRAFRRNNATIQVHLSIKYSYK